MKRITIIGTGYVGLVTGACLAEMGNIVVCLDIDQKKIDSLKKGKAPFYEPGLEELVKRESKTGRLSFTTSYPTAMREAEICFLALPTPSLPDGSCDYSFVFKAAAELAKHITDYLIVINKSTIPVGTTEKMRQIIADVAKDAAFDVVSNPEFLQEGSAIYNSMHPDRIILGVESERAQKILEQLYAPFRDRILVMDIVSAELSKYAANAMLALRISFMNHFSGLCEKVGGDIEQIRLAIGSDPRIGERYLQPGIGFGGSCLPKDVEALCAIAEECGHPSDFFQMILKLNQIQKKTFFQKILTFFQSLEGKTLAIWGLSFKPNTDDLRHAPSLDLIQMCIEHGASLRLFDPIGMPNARTLLRPHPNITFCHDEYDAAEKADAIILVTEWPAFSCVDFGKLSALMKNKVLFDGRNFYDKEEMENLGFEYFCVGKNPKLATQWIG